MSRDFESIYRLYFSSVYQYIYSRSGDSHLAEEITAETFLKALKTIDTYRGDGSLEGWLKRIAQRIYIDQVRKNSKLSNDETLENIAAEFSLEETVVEAELIHTIEQSLHQLSSPYKEVFQLRTYEEMDYNAIGTLFGKSANWACVVYHRAKVSIQQRMEETQE